MSVNYDGRRFRAAGSSPGGDVDSATIFHYRQTGDIVWATYQGGGVTFGTLVAAVRADGALDMRYQQVSITGAIKTGRCESRPERLADGRLRLHERWRWTEGGDGEGTSIVEELAADTELASGGEH